MRYAFLPLACLLAVSVSAEEPPPLPPRPPRDTACIKCHSQLDGAALEPTKRAADDIHFEKGLSCHDCHGGNPTPADPEDVAAAHDEKKGFIGKPSRKKIPEVCARCHSDADFMKRFDPKMRVDQLSEYRTSVHGKRNATGDEKPAVCIDCHGVHGIRAVHDPRSSVYPTNLAATCAHCHNNGDLMRAYNRETNQYAAYQTSVHAKALHDKGDLSAPTCNDCHGSHGAVPPGVDNVANVCGSCHSREASLFRETEAKLNKDLRACIRCVICHDNHAIQPPTPDMLGVGPKSTCVGCHTPEVPQYGAAERMAAAAAELRDGLAKAEGVLDRAERAGMEVSTDKVALRAAHDKVIEARVLAHSFDEPRFLANVQEGLGATKAAVAAGERAFRELRNRRFGLGVSLVVILVLIAGLWMKLRAIESA